MQTEHLNDINGHACGSCDDLSFGQCLGCYNCRFVGEGYSGKCENKNITDPVDSSKRYYYNDTFYRYLGLDPTQRCNL